MSSSIMKLLARIQLKKNFWQPISVISIYIFAYTIFSLYQTNTIQRATTWGALLIILGVSFIFSIVFDVFLVGLYRYYLNEAERKESLFSDLLYSIKCSPDRIVVISLLKSLCTKLPIIPGGICLCLYYINGYNHEILVALGILLLTIGAVMGYIISLGFSQCFMIAADNSMLSATSIIKRSFRIMKGNKERFFTLQLSFIPLFIIGIFTMYIGFFIIIPYYVATTCYFYLELNNRIRPEMYFRNE